ncbi:MAG: ABC transporter ATP-binding protein [Clostridiaceae bacterium]|jgi:ABC-2 type transport system ATP-binding protein|nr:ABC transporter ATP-binding protein [Clostridiaceae bacterium]
MYNIELRNISKCYKNGVVALDNISFNVKNGVFGLLGHNGAGKTTLLKALVTVLKPDSGSIKVCGYDLKSQGDEVRKRIGYLPQELSMYPSLSVFDFVNYMAQIKGVYDKNQVNIALQQVEMLEFSKRKIGQLSGGMKRRVGIAQALVGNPEILVLDEPTSGLDPEERVRFRGILSRFAKDDKTIILSTHIIEDVYQVCEELAVLRKGRLFYAGASADLINHVEGKIKVIKIDNENQLFDIQKQAVVISTTYASKGLTVRIVDKNMNFPGAESVSATLEDAYVYCMGGKNDA